VYDGLLPEGWTGFWVRRRGGEYVNGGSGLSRNGCSVGVCSCERSVDLESLRRLMR
jgi:hypothetical protein